MLTERRSPWFSSTRLRPTALTAPGRSSATRAGFATEKLAGAAETGFFMSIVNTTPVEVSVASTFSIALVVSAAGVWAVAMAAHAVRPATANLASTLTALPIDILISSPLPPTGVLPCGLLQLQLCGSFDPFAGGVLDDF